MLGALLSGGTERERQAGIVRYWRAVELFSPQKVDRPDPAQDMYSVAAGRPLPWEPGHRVRAKSLPPKCVRRHTVYAGVFDLDRVRETLTAVFGDDGQGNEVDGRLGGSSAMLSFTVTDEGLLVKESMTLSSCAWAVGRSLAPGPTAANWLDGFDADAEQLRGTLLELADGELPVVVRAAGAGGGRSGVGNAVLGAIAGVASNIVLGVATGGVASVASAAAGVLGPLVGPTVGRLVTELGDAAATAAVDAAVSAVTGAPAASEAADPSEASGASDPSEVDGPPSELGTKPLTVEDLAALTRWVAEQLGVAGALRPDAIRVKCQVVREDRAEDADQADFLNSFIAEDLDRVADALAEGRAGRALTEYLRPDSSLHTTGRIDVRQRPDVLLAGVRPELAPAGRWLQGSGKPLVLSQQFAVNTAISELGGPTGAGVYAVNGPPGTGKTTMLRDLVAALVVQRAEVLAGFARARDAFGAPVVWESDGRRYSVRPPKPELTGFEIVIASANNGAVANVTSEIPAKGAIDWEEWGDAADYLSEPARILLDAPAWGAIAARLGNRGNRSQFVSRFWWGNVKRAPQRRGSRPAAVDEPAPRGLRELLALQQTRPPARAAAATPAGTSAPAAAPSPSPELPRPLGTESWSQSVRSFTTARAEVDRLTAERLRVARALERSGQGNGALLAARAELPEAQRSLAAAQLSLQSAQDQLVQVQGRVTAARDLEVTARAALAGTGVELQYDLDLCTAARDNLAAYDARNRPGLLRSVVDGRAESRWAQGRLPLAAALQAAEASWERTRAESVRGTAGLAAATAGREAAESVVDRYRARVRGEEGQVRAAEQALTEATQRVDTIRGAASADATLLTRSRQSWDGHVPGPEWRAAPDDRDAAETRELSAPWMDRELALARSRLFLAALDLHRALLASEPALLQSSLNAALEVVGGKASADLPEEQARAAWQLFFLVVPVVSTTFASLDRMFPKLGRETLGWLFIDEAGQAAPQQAVGALWRCRRAVVVGDPLQLEPVVSLPGTAQQRLRRQFGVAEEWLPGLTSVQRRSDRLARYGTWLPSPVPDSSEDVWVGSPLRVHRRCDRLMFEVSNAIAYNGMMVFGTGAPEPYPLVRESLWLDVGSADAQGKWIPAQGTALLKTVREIRGRLLRTVESELATAGHDDVPSWADPQNPADPAAVSREVRRRLGESLFVVSPFRDVVKGIRDTLGDLLPRERVGTVHTTQGKEADIVIIVLGTARDRPGLRDWASATPNLLNVAVSRARRRLLVIGDQQDWAQHRYFDELAAHEGLRTPDISGWLAAD